MKYLALALTMALSACSSTIEEREMWRDTGIILATTAIEVIRDIGLGPDDIDPKVLKIANGACLLLRAGGPVVVLVINSKVAEANAEALEDEQTELVTVEEYLATLDGICDVIVALVTPSEPATDV